MKTENTPNELTAASIAQFKLQEANKKEILGDRKIVELEHDKTVLKAELKAKDAMLEKMSESIQALIDNISPIFKTEIEMKKEQIDIFYDFEKWLKKFKKSENDCFWYNNKTLFCREAMFEIYLEQI